MVNVCTTKTSNFSQTAQRQDIPKFSGRKAVILYTERNYKIHVAFLLTLLGWVMLPTRNKSSLFGCQVGLKVVSHRPVWLLWFTWEVGLKNMDFPDSRLSTSYTLILKTKKPSLVQRRNFDGQIPVHNFISLILNSAYRLILFSHLIFTPFDLAWSWTGTSSTLLAENSSRKTSSTPNQLHSPRKALFKMIMKTHLSSRESVIIFFPVRGENCAEVTCLLAGISTRHFWRWDFPLLKSIFRMSHMWDSLKTRNSKTFESLLGYIRDVKSGRKFQESESHGEYR